MKEIDYCVKQAGSLRKAAKTLGVDPSSLSRVRHRKEPVGFDLAIGLQTHFGIDARDLITRQLWDRFAIYQAAKQQEAKNKRNQRKEPTK